MPNPRTKEFGLRHRFAVNYQLKEYETTPNSFATLIPLFNADQAKTEVIAQAVQVNPVNDTYEGVVETNSLFMNSRVNFIKLTESYKVPEALDVPDVLFHKSIITWGLGDHAILDPQGNTILSKLKFTKAADTIHPTWTNVDMVGGSDLPAEVDGLTADQEIEGVDLRPDDIRDIMQGSLGAKISKMVDGPFINRSHKDFPYFREDWYRVPGRVKRANAFTGCFMYTGLNDSHAGAGTVENWFSPHINAELTIDEATLFAGLLIEFNEYNDSFDQSA